MDTCTKYLEEIREHRIVTNGMLETMFDVNNVSMALKIAILKKYVGKKNFQLCESESKNQKELYKKLKDMVIAIKKYRPPVGI